MVKTNFFVVLIFSQFSSLNYAIPGSDTRYCLCWGNTGAWLGNSSPDLGWLEWMWNSTLTTAICGQCLLKTYGDNLKKVAFSFSSLKIEFPKQNIQTSSQYKSLWNSWDIFRASGKGVDWWKDFTVWQSKLHGDSGRFLGLGTSRFRRECWTGHQLDRAQGLE